MSFDPVPPSAWEYLPVYGDLSVRGDTVTAYPISGSPEDRQAVADVTIAYCWALDTRDWTALEQVFLVDATARLGPECVGLDAIKERVSTALTPLDHSQHCVSNHQVHVDGDVATSRCYLVAQHTMLDAEGGANFTVAGRYEDSMERTSDGWRIRRRELTMTWTEGNPKVMHRQV